MEGLDILGAVGGGVKQGLDLTQKWEETQSLLDKREQEKYQRTIDMQPVDLNQFAVFKEMKAIDPQAAGDVESTFQAMPGGPNRRNLMSLMQNLMQIEEGNKLFTSAIGRTYESKAKLALANGDTEGARALMNKGQTAAQQLQTLGFKQIATGASEKDKAVLQNVPPEWQTVAGENYYKNKFDKDRPKWATYKNLVTGQLEHLTDDMVHDAAPGTYEPVTAATLASDRKAAATAKRTYKNFINPQTGEVVLTTPELAAQQGGLEEFPATAYTKRQEDRIALSFQVDDTALPMSKRKAAADILNKDTTHPYTYNLVEEPKEFLGVPYGTKEAFVKIPRVGHTGKPRVISDPESPYGQEGVVQEATKGAKKSTTDYPGRSLLEHPDRKGSVYISSTPNEIRYSHGSKRYVGKREVAPDGTVKWVEYEDRP